MSNYGQAALTIVGFVVGSYFGYPQLGLVIGSLAGQALFPTQLPGAHGPRLQDLRATQAQVGAPVMEVFGTDAVPGVVMYTGLVTEIATTENVGGKGGPEQDVTSYSYYQTIAVGLCRGPMGGIKQIFENGKLVYDKSPQREDETDIRYANRIIWSDEYAEGFNLYLGDEDQLPDPTLQAEIGLEDVPGFRGLMYIVYPERELKSEQGYRHPNFKFIVFEEGEMTCEPATDYSTDILWQWSTDVIFDPRNPLNNHEYSIVGGTLTNFDDAFDDLEAATGYSLESTSHHGWSITPNNPGAIAPYPALIPGERVDLYLWYNFRGRNEIDIYDLLNVGTPICNFVPNEMWWTGRNSALAHGLYSHPLKVWTEPESSNFYCGLDRFLWQWADVPLRVRRIPSPPPNPCVDPRYFPSSLPGYVVSPEGLLVECTPWSLDLVPYKVLRKYLAQNVGGVDLVTQYPLMPARPTGHDDYNSQAFWEDAYTRAVSRGEMPPGLSYPGDYPQGEGYGYIREFDLCSLESGRVSIASIISRVCSRVGLTNIDVSDLQDRYVTGYVISRVMNARDAIDPLRLVGFFDIVESGRIIKFIARGKNAVRTLDEDDLAAHEFGQEVPPAVVTRKMQDVELPRQIRLHYRDPARDYEDSEELSPTRLITTAVNDVDIECPVAITGTQAAQAAEVNWASAWAGRWIQQISIDLTQYDLEPADCIVVPVDGRLERVRIVAADGPVNLRKIEGVRDDSDGYVSVAISEPPVRPPAQIDIYSATQLILLDLPALRVEDDNAGVYAVARAVEPDLSWSGVAIYHSRDGGSTFSNVAAITTQAVIGTLLESLPSGDPFTWDDSVTIEVQVQSGSFESRTEEDVLNGANALAIGRHRFWEIVQFTTAEQISSNTWRLSHLLRGRRGTEHLMGTAVEGDQVVLISGFGVVRLPLSTIDIGVDQIYRAVTINTAFNSGVDQVFVPDARALYPFSPVQLETSRDTSDDLIINWVRRDRIGHELDPDGTPLPMSESTETYEVEIYGYDTSETLLRTFEVNSATTVTYTAAQQLVDGVSGTPVLIRIYQLSSVVGRGPALEGISV